MAIYYSEAELLPCTVSRLSTQLPQRTTPEYPNSELVCVPLKKKHLLITDLKYASSLRNTDKLLTSQCPIKHGADGQLGFLLHTITGLHWSSLTHYYGFICHLTPTSILSFPLMDASGFCPDVVTGFPSYCTGSLLDIPPSNTALV